MGHASPAAPSGGARPDAEGATAMTVCLPVYQESAVASQAVRGVVAFALRHPEIELVFADDGSPDDTPAIIEREILAAEIAHPGLAGRVRLMRGGVNRGKAGVIRHALERLTGDPLSGPPRQGAAPLFVFMDGDLAYDPAHLLEMRRLLERYDVVIGSRHMSEAGRGPQGLLRRLMGVVFNALSRICLRRAYRDTQAGLKGFRTPAAREIFSRLTVSDFSFDVELLFVARKRGYSIGEMPATVSAEHRRVPSNVRLFRDPLRMFLSLLRIRLNAWRGRYR